MLFCVGNLEVFQGKRKSEWINFFREKCLVGETSVGIRDEYLVSDLMNRITSSYWSLNTSSEIILGMLGVSLLSIVIAKRWAKLLIGPKERALWYKDTSTSISLDNIQLLYTAVWSKNHIWDLLSLIAALFLTRNYSHLPKHLQKEVLEDNHDKI